MDFKLALRRSQFRDERTLVDSKAALSGALSFHIACADEAMPVPSPHAMA